MSKRDSQSSSLTGVSTQMEVEGTWDEDIPLDQIHNSILEFLSSKLERLRDRYIQSKKDKRDNLMGRIVKYRMAYQKFVHVTRDILQKCEGFLKDRRDSPGSRVAYINNVQQYISQAREFVKLDLKFKRISPTLLNHLEPTDIDTPEVFKRKRYIKNTISSILNNEKTTCLTSTGIGKLYRNKQAHQSQFLSRGFNAKWSTILPPAMTTVINGLSTDDERWLAMLVFLFSKGCSERYIHNGFCPSCLFPIIIPRETREGNAGTVYCPACFKEITWTYFINHSSIKDLFGKFHPAEVKAIMMVVRGEANVDDDEYFEGMVRDIFQRGESSSPPPSTICEQSSASSVSSVSSAIGPSSSSTPVTHTIQIVRQRIEQENVKFKQLFGIIMERIHGIYGSGGVALDRKNIKESYEQFAIELYNIEGGYVIKAPRGFFPALKRYMDYYHKSEERISRKMIHDALISLGYEEYTKHISYIANKMYNYPFPDFSEKRITVLIECVLFKIMFGIISGKGSKRIHVNNYYIISKVIENNGYTWTEDAFRISENTRKKQEKIIGDICEIIYSKEVQGPSSDPPHQ